MNARIRRRIEMGRTALLFSRKHPDPALGDRAAGARLEKLLERADQLLIQQERGRAQEHAGAAKKLELRRNMRMAHLDHLAAAAAAASIEVPELRQKFVIGRSARPFHVFQATLRTIEAEAVKQQDLLERHGMARPVLESLREHMSQFDSAIAEVTGGRMAHVGARAELEQLARDIVNTVRLMNGFNQIRLARDPEALAAWNSARKVLDRAGRPELTLPETEQPAR